MNFYIRTNLSNKLGIGHLVRTTRLAQKLTKLGHKCFFFVDKNILINSNYTKGVNLKNLYQKNKNFKNETQDAKLFVNHTKKISKGYVIVDDYRLSYKWERFVKKFHLKLIAFDDLEKRHFADVIINSKINRNLKKTFLKNNSQTKTQFLLGPKYSIIDSNTQFKKNNKFQIIFYVGGGGDLYPIAKIIKPLQSMIQTLEKKISLIIIIGPLSKNKKKITHLLRKYKNVNFLEGENNIIKYLKTSKIFVGTSGTSIYETAYSKIPSLLFQISKNQENNSMMLEKIGHYLNFGKKDFQNYLKIAKLIFLLIKKYKRFKNMIIMPEIKIDKNGIDRIVNSLFNSFARKLNDKNLYLKGKNLNEVNHKYKIRKVNDKDINHYLFSRNLDINRSSSISQKKISTIDHYLWWFNSDRESFVLTKNDKKILYFFHENVFLNNQKFWWGGWFPASEECDINEILYALKIQLEITNNKSKKIKWISVIRKNNIIALNLIKNLGFKELKGQINLIKSIKKNFNTNKNFVYYSNQK